eukprot:1148880-Pelagomonas_calceolata.AAC.4
MHTLHTPYPHQHAHTFTHPHPHPHSRTQPSSPSRVQSRQPGAARACCWQTPRCAQQQSGWWGPAETHQHWTHAAAGAAGGAGGARCRCWCATAAAAAAPSACYYC